VRTTHRAAARHGTPGRRHRLLLVEDELSTVFAMREYFALAGYEVDCAPGLDEALPLLNRHSYEAVITDLHLTAARTAEGLVVAAQARRRNPQACIVMLTAYGSETTEEDARRCGVDLYQTKPVELTRLNRYLDLMLRRQPAAWAELDPKWHSH
jgi:DNA-binding response OmpR family regulator